MGEKMKGRGMDEMYGMRDTKGDHVRPGGGTLSTRTEIAGGSLPSNVVLISLPLRISGFSTPHLPSSLLSSSSLYPRTCSFSHSTLVLLAFVSSPSRRHCWLRHLSYYSFFLPLVLIFSSYKMQTLHFFSQR